MKKKEESGKNDDWRQCKALAQENLKKKKTSEIEIKRKKTIEEKNWNG